MRISGKNPGLPLLRRLLRLFFELLLLYTLLHRLHLMHVSSLHVRSRLQIQLRTCARILVITVILLPTSPLLWVLGRPLVVLGGRKVALSPLIVTNGCLAADLTLWVCDGFILLPTSHLLLRMQRQLGTLCVRGFWVDLTSALGAINWCSGESLATFALRRIFLCRSCRQC